MKDRQEILDELLQLELIWKQHNQRLHILELKEATQGINADPSVTMEIRQITAKMDDLEHRYRVLSSLLSDYHAKRLLKKVAGGCA